MQKALFPHFFSPEELGSSLKEVGTDLVQAANRDVVSRWFHSAQDADLFIWSDLKRSSIIKQQISFYGQVVEWNLVEGLKTGLIVDEEGSSGRIKGSEVIRFDTTPQNPPIEQAMALIEFIPGLSPDDKTQLLRNFQDRSMSSVLSHEEFLRRFGDQEPKNAPKVSWWQRLLKRLS